MHSVLLEVLLAVFYVKYASLASCFALQRMVWVTGNANVNNMKTHQSHLPSTRMNVTADSLGRENKDSQRKAERKLRLESHSSNGEISGYIHVYLQLILIW